MAVYHKYAPKEIPEDKNSVVETCACGSRRIRYKNGDVRYIWQDETIRGKIEGSCPGKKFITEPQPEQVFQNIQKEVATESPRLNNIVQSAHIRTAPVQPQVDHRRNLPLEAHLKDQLVIIRLMFEEMVKQGLMNTQSCQMAGRYLYSGEHRALVEHLCPEFANILSGKSAQPADGRSRNGRRTKEDEEVELA